MTAWDKDLSTAENIRAGVPRDQWPLPLMFHTPDDEEAFWEQTAERFLYDAIRSEGDLFERIKAQRPGAIKVLEQIAHKGSVDGERSAGADRQGRPNGDDRLSLSAVPVDVDDPHWNTSRERAGDDRRNRRDVARVLEGPMPGDPIDGDVQAGREVAHDSSSVGDSAPAALSGSGASEPTEEAPAGPETGEADR